jgi:hypothetical protein
MPKSLTSLIQRGGRGARNPAAITEVIVFYEPKLLPRTHRPPPKRQIHTDKNPRAHKHPTASTSSQFITNSQQVELDEPADSDQESLDERECDENETTIANILGEPKRIFSRQKDIDPFLLKFLMPRNAASATPPKCRMAVMYKYFGNDRLGESVNGYWFLG